MKRPNIVQVNEEDSQCQSCNWVGDVMYVTGRDDAEGGQFFQQNGGLCAECFLAALFEAE